MVKEKNIHKIHIYKLEGILFIDVFDNIHPYPVFEYGPEGWNTIPPDNVVNTIRQLKLVIPGNN